MLAKTNTVRVAGGKRTAHMVGPIGEIGYIVTAVIQFDSGNYYQDAKYTHLTEAEAEKKFAYEVRVNSTVEVK